MGLDSNLDKLRIFNYYNHRCIRCSRKATVIHEKIPRSKLKNALKLSNRVPLCNDCHVWAHQRGTRNSIQELTRCQIKYIKQNRNKHL